MANFSGNGPENQVCKEEIFLKRKLQSVEQRLSWYSGKDEMISFLLPCKTAKNEYVEQEPAEYIFQCMDGVIHIPEYGLRTDFYYKEWSLTSGLNS